jgi:nicotinamide-nucleotide amidase
MKACLIAVGSEMLTPFRLDTNSLAVTRRLDEIGFDVRFKAVVGDDVGEVARALAGALEWADLVVVTGGLGPTADDVTREAMARVLDVPLDLDETILARIRERMARVGVAMPDINRRQAMVPRGAIALPNPHGTAPGLWIERGRIAIVALPGPPREMEPMLDAVVRERLTPRSGGVSLYRRVLKIAGRAESEVDAVAEPVYSRWIAGPVPITTTILAAQGQIELHLTARAAGHDLVAAALDRAVRELQTALGDAVFSVDGRPLEAVVGALLRSKAWTLAVAESCSGGLLASRLTDVPGSSDYFDRGHVCYSNRSKMDVLGVPPELIAQHGAVSEPVARAMADGVRTSAGAQIGIGVTGIAGPGGGTPEKPVGTVVIAVTGAAGDEVRSFRFPGAREAVKARSAQAAMNTLRLRLLAAGARA